ncbi:ABC transporter ATP-binding protein [Devosia sp. A369]
MQPLVHFNGITKTYGNATAVQNLELTIEAGQFVTLLGPSGCGKSTTLRMLGGFEAPTAGEIYLSGKPISHLPPNRRNVNTVFQDYAIFPHLNVARNIAFGLELKGISSGEIEKRVSQLLDLVSLQGFRSRMPHQLSGGQRQRVALTRALAPDPEVLLLDEPLSALDAKLRQQMQSELKSIQQKTGKTFIFVTHDQDEAITMSDVIVVMNKGAIEQMGSPQELYARPQTRFVADFFGRNNFIEAIVTGVEGDRLALDWKGVSIHAFRNGTTIASGRHSTVAVRPEAIFCSIDKPHGGLALKGQVTSRQFRGSHTSLIVTLDNNEALELQLDAVEAASVTTEQVWVGWSEADAVAVAA